MNIVDSDFISLVLASREEKCDCFLTPELCPNSAALWYFAQKTELNTVVILPGHGFMPEFIYDDFNRNNLHFYPSSILYDLSFWESDKAKKIDEVVLLNAELADDAEYGFLRDYTRIVDIRAGIPWYFHLVAVFSGHHNGDCNKFLTLFGCKNAVKVGSHEMFFSSELFANSELQIDGIAEYLSYERDRTVVFCATRREAEVVSRKLIYRGILNELFHGGLPDEKKEMLLKKFTQRMSLPVVATKSILQYSVFLPSAKPICFGVPYSISHAARMANFSSAAVCRVKCFYCADDTDLMMKLNSSYAEQYADNPEYVIHRRNSDLLEMLKRII